MALFTELPSREIPGTSRAEGTQKLAPLVPTRTYNKYGATWCLAIITRPNY